MKIIRIIVIFVLLLLFNCDEYNGEPIPNIEDDLLPNQICFSIVSANFSGDWSFVEYASVDNYNLWINTTPPDSNDPVNIESSVTYTSYWDGEDETYYRIPQIYFDTTANYILEATGYNQTALDFHSEFLDNEMPQQIFDDTESLQNGTDNNLTLNYTANPIPGLDIETEIIDVGIVSDAYDYHPQTAYVHNAGYPLYSINIAVMAEGYRADQIESFRIYVADAFKDTASFHVLDGSGTHTHVNNDFFAHYWNSINIIRYDTISPHAGIDQGYSDDVQSIFNLGLSEDRKIPDYARIRYVVSQTESDTDISMEDLDAIILLVNDPNTGCYSFPYDCEIGERKSQPINIVVIKAIEGYDPAIINFHNEPFDIPSGPGVRTDCIAHELGHALTRLQDEYIDLIECAKNRPYYEKFRNIDDNEPYKWQWFIDNGYNTSSNNPVGIFPGGFYCSQYYRPTDMSTMNKSPKDLGIITSNIQFGPVNTYHLVASFKLRTGDTYQEYDNEGFEWESYPLLIFSGEWPPYYF